MFVFVYGTLKKGHGNHKLLQTSEFLGQAFLPKAKMLDLGSFPALIPGTHQDQAICGELYRVDDLVLRHLDYLEGHPRFYERREVQIFAQDEIVKPFKAETAWVYFLSRDSQASYEKKCPLIPEGIWPRPQNNPAP